MIWPMRRCLPGALAAGDHRGRSRSRCSSSRGPGLDCPSGSLPAWWPKPWATRRRSSGTRASPMAPDKQLGPRQRWRPSAEGRISLAKACARPPGLCPPGCHRRASVRPLNLASWPSIEGLIFTIRWHGMDGDRDGLFLFFVVPHRFKRTQRLPLARWLQQRSASALTSPRFQPTHDPTTALDAQRFGPVAHCPPAAAVGAAVKWPCSWQVACCEIPHRFASGSRRSLQHQGPPASRSIRRCLPASETTKKAAGAVLGWPPTFPRPDRRFTLIAQFHSFPRAAAMVWASPLLRPKSGTLAVEALWGDEHRHGDGSGCHCLSVCKTMRRARHDR